MKKSNLLAAGLLVAGMCLSTSCSDNTFIAATPDEDVTAGFDKPTLALVNESGKEVNNLPGTFGTYYLDIKAQGKWKLESTTPFLALDQTSGEGPARVKLLVGSNWGAARTGGVTLYSTDAASTRAEGDGTTTTVNQTSQFNPSDVKDLLSSNKGAGYSYQPYSNYCLGTHIQLFNMKNLAAISDSTGVTFLTDEIYPVVEEEVTTADSEESLSSKLSVAASVNLNFNAFSADVKGAYNSSSGTSNTKQYAVKRMKSYQYTREIDFMNIIAMAESSEEMEAKLLAPGFVKLRNDFTNNIKKATATTPINEETVKKYCKSFVDEIGPCFVSKSVMGCVLDYYISMDKSLVTDTMSVSGALDIKFQTSVSVTGDGAYDDNKKNSVKNVEAKINVRGGDVSQVSILTTGGTLKNEDLLAWQQSIEPKSAVMIDMKLVPIYLLISDQAAKTYLQSYLESIATVPPKLPGEEQKQQ